MVPLPELCREGGGKAPSCVCVQPLCLCCDGCSNAHAKRPNFNANGAFVDYTSNFLCNCAAQQIQQIPDQCEQWLGELTHLKSSSQAIEVSSSIAQACTSAAPRAPLLSLPLLHDSCKHIRPTTCPALLLLPPLLAPPPPSSAVVELCHKYKDQLLTPQLARLGIMPLLAALQRLSPGQNHLTPLHADVLQL